MGSSFMPWMAPGHELSVFFLFAVVVEFRGLRWFLGLGLRISGFRGLGFSVFGFRGVLGFRA